MKVVNCRSEEHANAYLAELDKQGYKWGSGIRLKVQSNWEVYKSETCYELRGKWVSYSPISYYLEHGYEIEVYKGESTNMIQKNIPIIITYKDKTQETFKVERFIHIRGNVPEVWNNDILSVTIGTKWYFTEKEVKAFVDGVEMMRDITNSFLL